MTGSAQSGSDLDQSAPDFASLHPGYAPFRPTGCLGFVVVGDRIDRVRKYIDTRKGWWVVFGEGAQ